MEATVPTHQDLALYRKWDRSLPHLLQCEVAGNDLPRSNLIVYGKTVIKPTTAMEHIRMMDLVDLYDPAGDVVVQFLASFRKAMQFLDIVPIGEYHPVETEQQHPLILGGTENLVYLFFIEYQNNTPCM